MPTKRRQSAEVSDLPEDEAEPPRPTKKPKKSPSEAEGAVVPDRGEEYQQITDAEFVGKYKLHGLLGGDCYYMPEMISREESKLWYDQLLALDTYQPLLKMYGRSFPQPRQIAAYSTTPLTLSYSGTEVIMHWPFPPVLQEIAERVEGVLGGREGGVRFNHCMLNWYKDGEVYIGKHSDNLENKIIASLSLGAPRSLILSPRLPSKSKSKSKSHDPGSSEPFDPDALARRENRKLLLGDGSLFVMQGRTQEYWKHEIPKERRVKEGRISLTFRQLVYI